MAETTILENDMNREEPNWDLYFLSLLELVGECERLWGTTDLVSRENIQVRLEFVILSLQQIIIAINTVENRQKLNEVLRNMSLLHESWYGNTYLVVLMLQFIPWNPLQ